MWKLIGSLFFCPKESVQRDIVELRPESFCVTSHLQQQEVRWEDVEEIWAFKRDLYSVDQICLEFITQDGDVIVVTEDHQGFRALEAAHGHAIARARLAGESRATSFRPQRNPCPLV